MNAPLSNILEQYISTSVLLFDAQHRLVYANNAAEVLLGQSFKQTEYKQVEHLFVEGCISQTLIERCLQEQRPGFLEFEFIVTPFAEWRPRHIFFHPVSIQQSTYVLIEVLLLEGDNLARDRALMQQNQVNQSLTRNLAHEIKNPLSGLRGAAQLMAKRATETELTKLTDIIIAEADRLGKLVDRMMTPAQIESKEWVNIHAVIDKAIDMIQFPQQADLVIQQDYDPSLPAVKIAQEHIYQALMNVINNAREALQGKGRITVRTRAMHQYAIAGKQYALVIKIDIEDTGPGIPEELKPVIFLPTISSKTTLNKQNQGLGLGIAQSLVIQNHGIIEFESHPGKTCFSICLPVIHDNHDNKIAT